MPVQRCRPGVRARLPRSYLPVVAVAAPTTTPAVSLSGHPPFDRAMRHLPGLPGKMGMAEMGVVARRDPVTAFADALFRPVAIATAGLAVVVVSRRITAPIRDLAGSGLPRGGEPGELTTSSSTLAAALGETERQRLTLLGDVAHERRASLATIQGYMEGLRDEGVARSGLSYRRSGPERGASANAATLYY